MTLSNVSVGADRALTADGKSDMMLGVEVGADGSGRRRGDEQLHGASTSLSGQMSEKTLPPTGSAGASERVERRSRVGRSRRGGPGPRTEPRWTVTDRPARSGSRRRDHHATRRRRRRGGRRGRGASGLRPAPGEVAGVCGTAELVVDYAYVALGAEAQHRVDEVLAVRANTMPRGASRATRARRPRRRRRASSAVCADRAGRGGFLVWRRLALPGNT